MNTVKGYHYTNSEAYESMKTKGIDEWITFKFDDFTGLIPYKSFIPSINRKFPYESHEPVVEGLLEPEPKNWIENPEFPHLWRFLMGDVCRGKEIILLSFELNEKDKAFVVERAHRERELYKTEINEKLEADALMKYWESRVPALEYHGNYAVPQLAIWSGIEFDRLKVEWRKPKKEVYERVLRNNW